MQVASLVEDEASHTTPPNALDDETDSASPPCPPSSDAKTGTNSPARPLFPDSASPPLISDAASAPLTSDTASSASHPASGVDAGLQRGLAVTEIETETETADSQDAASIQGYLTHKTVVGDDEAADDQDSADDALCHTETETETETDTVEQVASMVEDAPRVDAGQQVEPAAAVDALCQTETETETKPETETETETVVHVASMLEDEASHTTPIIQVSLHSILQIHATGALDGETVHSTSTQPPPFLTSLGTKSSLSSLLVCTAGR